jgi:methyl acetate hydrolase
MGIDNVFRKPIEAGLIPGVVALAADDRGVFYDGAFGRRAVDKPEPMTLDSVFRIASMTKAVTGTAAMQLVEEGRIGLDQPMGDVLPVIKNVKVLEVRLRVDNWCGVSRRSSMRTAPRGFAIRESRSHSGTC